MYFENSYAREQHETVVYGVAEKLATGSQEIEQSATTAVGRFFRIWKARRPIEALHTCASDARVDEYGFLCSRVFDGGHG